ncbi:MAG: hypothetical protein ACLP9S_07320 [Syntrophales bacterium]|jgi:hypothetical protein
MIEVNVKEIKEMLSEVLRILKDKESSRRHPAEIDAIIQGKIVDLQNRRERRNRKHGCEIPGNR